MKEEVLFFFDKMPDAVSLYEALEKRILSEIEKSFLKDLELEWGKKPPSGVAALASFLARNRFCEVFRFLWV